MTEKELMDRKWLNWAKELDFHGQCGLAYSNNQFDRERFQRMEEIAAEIMASYTDIPVETLSGIFAAQKGYKTPKLTTRSVLFVDGKVLLVREQENLWNLPGGWCDENQTIRENAVKELWEESGIRGHATRLVAVQDRNLNNYPPYVFNITNHLILCEPDGEIGPFLPNDETVERGFFPLDDLPPLDTNRTTEEQILLCWDAHQAEHWETRFD